MLVAEHLHACLNFAFLAEVGQRDQFEHHRKQDEGDAQTDIGDLDRIDAASARVKLLRSKEKDAANERRNHVAKRVQTLREIEPRWSGCLRAENGDVGIRRDLNDGDSRAENDECSKEQHILLGLRRWIEEQAADSSDDETKYKTVLVTDLVDGITLGCRDQEVGKGHQEVGAEECKLHKVRLKLREVEVCLELRDQQIVHAGNEPPHEEQRSDGHEGETIVSAGGGIHHYGDSCL